MTDILTTMAGSLVRLLRPGGGRIGSASAPTSGGANWAATTGRRIRRLGASGDRAGDGVRGPAGDGGASAAAGAECLPDPDAQREGGRARWSQHLYGRALDLKRPEMHDPEDWWQMAMTVARQPGSQIRGLGKYRTFVHLDIRPAARLVSGRRWMPTTSDKSLTEMGKAEIERLARRRPTTRRGRSTSRSRPGRSGLKWKRASRRSAQRGAPGRATTGKKLKGGSLEDG